MPRWLSIRWSLIRWSKDNATQAENLSSIARRGSSVGLSRSLAKQTSQTHRQAESSSPPLIPLSRPWIGPEEKAAVIEVLESGMLAQGPRVAALEDAFARMTGARHAIATSSGTTGLHLALLAHGIGPGDEVITSPFTFIASVNAILFTGAKPVFADIDEASFNIDPTGLEAAITPRTKALMPVHLYGQPCDMDEITAIAQSTGCSSWRTPRRPSVQHTAAATLGRSEPPSSACTQPRT